MHPLCCSTRLTSAMTMSEVGRMILVYMILQLFLWRHCVAANVCSLPVEKRSDVKCYDGDDPYKIKIGIILPCDHNVQWRLPRVGPAVEYATAKIEGKADTLRGYTFEICRMDSRLSDRDGPLAAVNMRFSRYAHVFLGPCFSFAVAPVARYSPVWNIPLLTAGARAEAFKSKSNEYQLLTRMLGSHAQVGYFFFSILQQFSWKKVAMVYPLTEIHKECYFIIEGIYERFPRSEREHRPFLKRFDEKIQSKRELLEELSLNARIVVLCASPASVREIMLKAEELNFINGEYVFFNIDLFSSRRAQVAAVVVLCASPASVREIMLKAEELNFINGEYVFFNIDLFSSKNQSARPWYNASDTDAENQRARKAYEALMTITLRKPESEAYRNFSEEVKRRAEDEYKNFTYGEEEVNSFVGAFHDAVILYALALNQTLEDGFNVTDGAEITKRMWNRTFEGITGTVSIDENGDRNADYSLLDLNPETQEFEVVANYYGNRKQYDEVPGKKIHWAGGRTGPPPDVPKCGFDKSKCPNKELPEYAIVIMVFSSLLIIVSLGAFFIYRHFKLEAELAEMSWRIRWEDIMFAHHGGPKRVGSRISLTRRYSSASQYSVDSIAVQLSNVGNKQMFTTTGYYKAAVVAIKKINKPSIQLSKPVLLEIKRMRDLQNDHLVRFIGACIDIPNMCILSEYCPKGSLQDVLENEQIKLDWMFRYSLMQDIIRGMAYLHSTEIRSHGNLKSSNAVVDSRFVLKITDFGLHSLRGTPYESDEDTYAFYRRKLWSAPELLRMHNRPPEGTQKGDVYSFAVVCQEIVYRNGPFYLEHMEMSPQDIYMKVKNGQKPFFRPTLGDEMCPNDELAQLIRRCWAEDPIERPDFHSLKTAIRKLNREGDSGNILDNLLSRMEQYANNLEALVEERTADYLEQKRKAEDLLYLMLPKSVAMQLIRGDPVAAEWFDETTIYFSDICGFTSLSSESTPMEVVDLLNDLYTTFDTIIEKYDVYKVETIGDAYMVVSGLPVKNGNLHAREIARMSLSLLEAVLSFKIRHRPDMQLKLRIGIHSGPVCAGVVGLKMPRYCLFGDTVNTASRMESNGLPLRIHVSPKTKEILDSFGSFYLDLRGPVEMKGKGSVITHWLRGEKGQEDLMETLRERIAQIDSNHEKKT
ncbi:atrial natriuretic peptide receptor 1 [Lingula anatina]|uniref:Guanylate cyclase n=1 Tax=Lingula anatina TaxID=7574 RepID=A0A1S3IRF8_LINAN|nr:atrial natriuretic peptide receptor 1 [Lingula anatina]|eukprot:XP_013400521.1 atrial natriuretic peptide receptor 1 [Lingula anatina]